MNLSRAKDFCRLEGIVSASAIERIVLQVTQQQKKAITAKAKRLGLPVSELMRRGAIAYTTAESEEELGVVADSAMAAVTRTSQAIDDVLSFVDASNKRITAMEVKAGKDSNVKIGNLREVHR